MPIVTAASTATKGPRQLSDQNTQGTVLGASASDLIGFYGTLTPSAQPSGGFQSALTRGAQAGVIATYSTTQSPSAAGANTGVESSFTVQTGTGFVMAPATGDAVFVNKLAAQAGLGVGNARISAANTVNVNFTNFTGGSITPTGSEVYKIATVRGLPTLTAALTPTAVAANSTVEQLFTIAGLPVGALVQVSKPTAQAGLEIVNARVSAANQLAITFANVTATPITPTAAETYTVFYTAGIDATSNDIMYGMNVGTVGAIGAGVVVSGGSTALNGVLASDTVVGIYDPTAQAAATNAAFPVKAVPTANTMTLYFAGIGSGATPTASEVYTLRTTRLNPVAPLTVLTQTLTPVSVAANTTAEQTFTVTGLVANGLAWVNKPSYTAGIGIVGVRVSAVNTLAITFANNTATAIVPPAEIYTIGNFQVQAPGAGNSVYQTASAALNGLANLGASIRAALVTLGLIAGS
jgi:hypothetical protein